MSASLLGDHWLKNLEHMPRKVLSYFLYLAAVLFFSAYLA